jgi:hypothetical protein
MKITNEERERIKRLHNLNEQLSFDEQEMDDMGGDDMDLRADDEAEKMFMDCLEQIRDMRDGDYDKSFYLELLDKYFEEKESMDSEEDLPY